MKRSSTTTANMKFKPYVIEAQVQYKKKNLASPSFTRMSTITVIPGRIEIVANDNKFPPLRINIKDLVSRPKQPHGKKVSWLTLNFVQNIDAKYAFVNIQFDARSRIEGFNALNYAWEAPPVSIFDDDDAYDALVPVHPRPSNASLNGAKTRRIQSPSEEENASQKSLVLSGDKPASSNSSTPSLPSPTDSLPSLPAAGAKGAQLQTPTAAAAATTPTLATAADSPPMALAAKAAKENGQPTTAGTQLNNDSQHPPTGPARSTVPVRKMNQTMEVDDEDHPGFHNNFKSVARKPASNTDKLKGMFTEYGIYDEKTRAEEVQPVHIKPQANKLNRLPDSLTSKSTGQGKEVVSSYASDSKRSTPPVQSHPDPSNSPSSAQRSSTKESLEAERFRSSRMKLTRDRSGHDEYLRDKEDGSHPPPPPKSLTSVTCAKLFVDVVKPTFFSSYKPSIGSTRVKMTPGIRDRSGHDEYLRDKEDGSPPPPPPKSLTSLTVAKLFEDVNKPAAFTPFNFTISSTSSSSSSSVQRMGTQESTDALRVDPKRGLNTVVEKQSGGMEAVREYREVERQFNLMAAEVYRLEPRDREDLVNIVHTIVKETVKRKTGE